MIHFRATRWLFFCWSLFMGPPGSPWASLGAQDQKKKSGSSCFTCLKQHKLQCFWGMRDQTLCNLQWYTSVPPDDYFFCWSLFMGPPDSPWASMGAQDQKKYSQGIHVSHAQNTVNYGVFGGWGTKNIIIYNVFAPPGGVDYRRVGRLSVSLGRPV